MSVSIGYCFNYEKELPDLAKDCNQWLGSSLKPSAGDPENAYRTFFNSVSLELGFNIFNQKYNPFGDQVEDDDIPYSRYKYNLDVTAYGGQGDMRPILLPVLLSAIFALHRRLGIVGILIFDSQILLAEYEEVEYYDNHKTLTHKTLADKSSGVKLSNYSSHFAEIMRRMPESWQSG